MTHSEYQELTGTFKGAYYTTNVTRSLITRPIHWNSETIEPGQPEHPSNSNWAVVYRELKVGDERVFNRLGELADSFVSENQARADSNLGPTADLRALVGAISKFLSVTSIPIPKIGAVYEKTRERAGEWLDLANEWFPVLLPPFLRKLRESESYKYAVQTGQITPPFEWNGTIKELATWLETWIFEPKTDDNGHPQVAGKKHNWAVADQVFTIGGVPVTARQLADAYKH